MARKSVTSVEYVGEGENQGRSFLELEIDGDKVARVYAEQPMARAGLIWLGPEFEDTHEAVLPADPRNSRFEERVVHGATDHPEALRLYWEWWHRINPPPKEAEG
jgi:hypothetical protein